MTTTLRAASGTPRERSAVRPRGRLLSALVAALALPLAVARAAEVPVPDAPTRWATDRAGFISGAARQALDARLEQLERETGRQVLVYIDRTTGDTPLEDWTVRAFQKWKVGRKGMDDGLVLFVFSDDRKLRIEVGYGLEGVIPDARAGQIIRDVAVPRLQANDPDAAVTDTVSALLGILSGDASPWSEVDPGAGRRGPPGGREPTPGEKLAGTILMGLLVAGFLVLLVTNPTLALWLLSSLLSGGRGGGRGGGGWGGGGGGGFSGGGGRSGGGGASGSW